jgi:hypothetical protein
LLICLYNNYIKTLYRKLRQPGLNQPTDSQASNPASETSQHNSWRRAGEYCSRASSSMTAGAVPPFSIFFLSIIHSPSQFFLLTKEVHVDDRLFTLQVCVEWIGWGILNLGLDLRACSGAVVNIVAVPNHGVLEC